MILLFMFWKKKKLKQKGKQAWSYYIFPKFLHNFNFKKFLNNKKQKTMNIFPNSYAFSNKIKQKIENKKNKNKTQKNKNKTHTHILLHISKIST